MPEYLDRICDFVVKTDFKDFNATVVEQAKKVLYDTIGAIAAGAQQNEPTEMANRLMAYGGHSTSTVVGQKKKMDPLNAVLINGTAGTWLELDEGNQFARGHAGVHVVPAALAIGEERGASGKELLTAIILGYEIACRIGIASKIRMTMHPHGTWGTIGAAVTVGKLMGIDVGQMKALINISSSMTLATSRKTMLEGGTVRNLYAGVSGYMGILAYHLLMSGFTGEADGIRSVYGGVVSDSFDPAMMVEGIGSRYEITRNYFKKYACCRYNHSSLDALYKIMGKQKERKIRPELVEHITIETYSLAAQLGDQNPGNMLAAKFSIPFAIATTIIHGNSGVECFLPDQVSQPKIRELAARVKVVEKPEFTQLMPSQRPSTVTIRFRNGEAFTETVFITRGDIEDPYSTEEIEEKFLDITSPIYGMEKAKAIVEKTKRIEAFNNIQDYTDGL
ncbi:MAG: MmgE/PrpD family protein [Thermodesulfobacteriota bacterium]|nr:MmgE/PrpD family protein [Thermodesulfobacteriota bacterium]